MVLPFWKASLSTLQARVEQKEGTNRRADARAGLLHQPQRDRNVVKPALRRRRPPEAEERGRAGSGVGQ
jgi:hypothetical protein